MYCIWMYYDVFGWVHGCNTKWLAKLQSSLVHCSTATTAHQYQQPSFDQLRPVPCVKYYPRLLSIVHSGVILFNQLACLQSEDTALKSQRSHRHWTTKKMKLSSKPKAFVWKLGTPKIPKADSLSPSPGNPGLCLQPVLWKDFANHQLSKTQKMSEPQQLHWGEKTWWCTTSEKVYKYDANILSQDVSRTYLREV
jgi:hypothetical protein